MNSVSVVYMFTALSINISVSAWNRETKNMNAIMSLNIIHNLPFTIMFPFNAMQPVQLRKV